jgi:hypothetical protein
MASTHRALDSAGKRPIQVREVRRKAAPKKPEPILDQQKSDFTAEGSPPPGKVATSVPVKLTDPVPDLPDASAPRPKE